MFVAGYDRAAEVDDRQAVVLHAFHVRHLQIYLVLDTTKMMDLHIRYGIMSFMEVLIHLGTQIHNDDFVVIHLY